MIAKKEMTTKEFLSFVDRNLDASTPVMCTINGADLEYSFKNSITTVSNDIHLETGSYRVWFNEQLYRLTGRPVHTKRRKLYDTN